jgi:hypothetical protein
LCHSFAWLFFMPIISHFSLTSLPHRAILVLSLFDVHEMQEYGSGRACLFLRMLQLEKSWTMIDDVWYAYYDIGGCLIIVLFNFLHFIIPTW